MGNGMILKLMFAFGMLAAVAVAQDTTKVARRTFLEAGPVPGRAIPLATTDP